MQIKKTSQALDAMLDERRNVFIALNEMEEETSSSKLQMQSCSTAQVDLMITHLHFHATKNQTHPSLRKNHNQAEFDVIIHPGQ